MERRSARRTTNNTAKTVEYGHVDSYSVDRVRDSEYGLYFSLTVNGVTVNDCKLIEGDKGVFISLPSKKGSDGKWYSAVWFRFSPEDAMKIINDVYKALEG